VDLRTSEIFTAESDPAYSYQPSLVGGDHEFRLTGRGLEWRVAGRMGEISYDRIRRLRLSYRPTTFQSRRFVSEIWPMSGSKLLIASTSRRGILDEERHDAAYAAFISELSRRVGAAGGKVSFETGSPPLIYWLGALVFVVTSLAMAVLIVRALMLEAWVPSLFISGFLLLFLWQTGAYFRRNRPRRYSPNAIPPDVLPRT
jgi:hypothetical protein